MLSIEKCREIDPNLNDHSDEQVREIRDALYDLGQLAIEMWLEDRQASEKNERRCGVNLHFVSLLQYY